MLRKFSTYNRKVIKIFVRSQLLETNFQIHHQLLILPSVFYSECPWRCICNITGYNHKWDAILIYCTKSSDYYM